MNHFDVAFSFSKSSFIFRKNRQAWKELASDENFISIERFPKMKKQSQSNQIKMIKTESTTYWYSVPVFIPMASLGGHVSVCKKSYLL